MSTTSAPAPDFDGPTVAVGAIGEGALATFDDLEPGPPTGLFFPAGTWVDAAVLDRWASIVESAVEDERERAADEAAADREFERMEDR